MPLHRGWSVPVADCSQSTRLLHSSMAGVVPAAWPSRSVGRAPQCRAFFEFTSRLLGVHLLSVAGSPGTVRHPVDLACHKGRAHCGHVSG